MYLVEDLKNGTVNIAKDYKDLKDVVLKMTGSEDVATRIDLTNCLLFKCEGLSVQYKDMRLSWHPNSSFIGV